MNRALGCDSVVDVLLDVQVGMEIRRLTVDLSDLRRRNGMPESILPRTANNS